MYIDHAVTFLKENTIFFRNDVTESEHQ